MLPTPLVVTIVVESLILLTLGVLLVIMHENKTTVEVIGVLLIVVAVIVASMLVFPDVLRLMIRTTSVCNM